MGMTLFFRPKALGALGLSIFLTVAFPIRGWGQQQGLSCESVFKASLYVERTFSTKVSDVPSFDWAMKGMRDSQAHLELAESKVILNTLMAEIFGETGEAIRNLKEVWAHGPRVLSLPRLNEHGFAETTWEQSFIEASMKKKPSQAAAYEAEQRKRTPNLFDALVYLTSSDHYDGSEFVAGTPAQHSHTGRYVAPVLPMGREPRKSLQRFWQWVDAHPERKLYAQYIVARSIDYLLLPMSLERGLELFDPAPRRLSPTERLGRWFRERSVRQEPSLLEIGTVEQRLRQIEKLVVRNSDLVAALEQVPLETNRPYQNEAQELQDKIAELNPGEVDLYLDETPFTAIESRHKDLNDLAPRVLHAGILAVTTLKRQSSAYGRVREKIQTIVERLDLHQTPYGEPWNAVRESKGLLELRAEARAAYADLQRIENSSAFVLEDLAKLDRALQHEPDLAGITDTVTLAMAQKAQHDMVETNERIAKEIETLLTVGHRAILRASSSGI